MPIKFQHIDFVFLAYTFGNTLRERRLDAKMSQREIGKLIGRSDSYINSIEHGNVTPTGLYLYDFLNLCNLFDLNPARYFALDI